MKYSICTYDACYHIGALRVKPCYTKFALDKLCKHYFIAAAVPLWEWSPCAANPIAVQDTRRRRLPRLNQTTTMSDSGDSSVSRKKSFSSRFSSKMDKLSNPFKKGDNSDSDSEDDSSSGKSRSIFGGKLHNPFKKGHSSDTDDDDRSSSVSPLKGRKFSRSGKSSPMPSHSAASSQLPDASFPTEDGPGLGGAQAAAAAAPSAPIPVSKSPAVATTATTAAPATTPMKAPAGTTDAVRATAPTAASAPAAAPATTAAAAASTAAPAPEPEPKKPRVTVGGPVFGAPEILLTGVKGDPDEVMKTLRARGFVVHLVRYTAWCKA